MDGWPQREIDRWVYGGEEEVSESAGKRWIMPKEAQPSRTQEPWSSLAPRSLECIENCGFSGCLCIITTVWSNYTRRYISVNKVKAIVSLRQRCTITENRCRVYVISFSSSGRQKLGSSNGMMLLMWGQRRKVARCLSRKRWSNMFDSNPIAEAALYWLNRFNGALVQ